MKILLWVCFLAASCLWLDLSWAASDERIASLPPRYHLDIKDRPGEKRFLMTLRSLDDRSLCIPVEKWPNRRGQVHFASTWVKLESSGRAYPARDENFGYCIEKDGGPCLIRIEARAEIKGFIRYAEFGDPATIAALSERQLHFPVTAWVCKKQRR